jgi:3-oxoadipate enol-lactonase
MKFDFMARPPALRPLTLVVCGTEDPGTPPSENRRLPGLVPGGHHEEIADARHFPNFAA